jgi:predicted nucleic acid-binding protein
MPRASDLFVDTSGWGYHLDRTDPLHTRVETLMREAVIRRRKLVTTNFIIHELVALLTNRYKKPRPQVIEAINAIKSDVSVEIVYIQRTIDDRAWALLEARPDQKWSLVDASSIIIMKDFRMTEALSTDECFPTEGLIKLLDARSNS